MSFAVGKEALPKRCPQCDAVHAWAIVQYGRGVGKIFDLHPCHVDGWSEMQCRQCEVRIGRWSGRVLAGTFADGEHEPPFGEKHGEGCAFAPSSLRLVAASKGDVR